MRKTVTRLCQKLADDADNPTYIFTQRRVGYRMMRGETKPKPRWDVHSRERQRHGRTLLQIRDKELPGYQSPGPQCLENVDPTLALV